MGYWKDLFKIRKVSDTRYISGLIYMLILIFGLFSSMIYLTNSATQPIPFEIEGSCNSGKVNIAFDAEFRNQEYTLTRQMWETQLSDTKNVSLTKYNTEFYPKSISFDGLENLNCNYKIKGAIPKNLLINGGLI